jgi:beta-glucosidase
LTYTTFGFTDLAVSGGETVTATFAVTNTGTRAGVAVPQLYLTSAPDGDRQRLLGFARVELQPGASREVTITADPRLLATFDTAADAWRIVSGTHGISLAQAADTTEATTEVMLTARKFGR